MLDINPFKKGAVFFARIPTDRNSKLPIMQGTRPVLILNTVNTSYNKVLVAPITTRPGKNGVHVTLEEGVDSIMLVDYIFPIYVKYLHTYLGSLSEKKMEEVFYAIDIFTGRTEASEEDIEKYFPNQSVYVVDIKLNPYYSIPVTAMYSPVNTIQENDISDYEENDPEPEPEEDTPIHITTNRKRGKAKFPSFDSMSFEELSEFANSTVEEIINNYNCAKGTAKRKIKLAQEKIQDKVR